MQSNRIVKFLFFLSFFSCRQELQKKSTIEASLLEGTDSQSSIQSNQKEVASDQKIDPKNLKIFNLAISNMRARGSSYDVGELVSFSVSGGVPDFANVRICPEEKNDKKCGPLRQCAQGGECAIQSAMYDRMIVPKLWDGKVTVQVSACLLPARSSVSGNTCGEWKEVSYNSHRFDEEVADLLIQKEFIIEQLQDAQEERRTAYENFLTEAEECIQKNAKVSELLDAKIRLIRQFLISPSLLVKNWVRQGVESFLNMFDKNAYGTSMDFMANTRERLFEEARLACNKTFQGMGNSAQNTTCDVLTSLAKYPAMMVEMLNPANSLPLFTGAIFDLAHLQDAVPYACLAEEKLTRLETDLSSKEDFLKKDLEVLKNQMIAKKLLVDNTSGALPTPLADQNSSQNTSSDQGT